MIISFERGSRFFCGSEWLRDPISEIFKKFRSLGDRKKFDETIKREKQYTGICCESSG